MFTILKMIRRSTERQEHAAVAMLGLRGGERVIILGAGRPDLAGAVAAATGLNGHAAVVDPGPEAVATMEAAAARAGALIEVLTAPLGMLPVDSLSFDVALLPAGIAALGAQAPLVLAEAIRVVRPGGRVYVCETVPRPGLFKLAQRGPVADPQVLTGRLTAAGLRAARHLGTLDGTAYFEAAKAR